MITERYPHNTKQFRSGKLVSPGFCYFAISEINEVKHVSQYLEELTTFQNFHQFSNAHSVKALFNSYASKIITAKRDPLPTNIAASDRAKQFCTIAILPIQMVFNFSI